MRGVLQVHAESLGAGAPFSLQVSYAARGSFSALFSNLLRLI
jgi:hypothetical protein